MPPARALVFAYPGDLATPSGGYEYDRQVIAGLKRLGWTVQTLSLGAGFPFPGEADRARAYTLLDDIPKDIPVVVDGLALGTLPQAGEVLGAGCLVALVHHPLALESGLDAVQAAAFAASERVALRRAVGVIVPSPATAAVLVSDYGVERARIAVVSPGTDTVALPARRARAEEEPVRLLSVGSLIPRKGHDVVLDALAGMAELPFHLDIAGSEAFDPPCAARVRALAGAPPLAGRVTLHGALPRAALDDLYAGADVFVLASRYEGYGMVFAEAIAHGLPVLATGAGAVSDTVPREAGQVFACDDAAGFTEALRAMLSDPALRARYAEGARRAAADLPDWDDAARAFGDAVTRLGGAVA